MSGPRKKPALQVVREGNPGKRPIPEQVVVPPATFEAPDWKAQFPIPLAGRKPNYPKRKSGESEYDFDKRIELYHHRLVRYELKVAARAAAKFCIVRAGEEWDRVVPVLKASVGLGNPDFSTVVDYCVCVARLEWCERDISEQGLVIKGQKGLARNPLTTVASQYRTQLKTYIGELGLSPSARTKVPSRKDDDGEEDPFD